MEKVLEQIWKRWKNAETPEEAAAYTDCYFMVKECIIEEEQKKKREQIAREENAIALVAALKELYKGI